MNLFDIVPSNYFSIFNGKNRQIYAESLLILFELLQNDEALINKQDFLKALKDKGASYVDKLDYTEEDMSDVPDEDDVLISQKLNSKAAFVIRRLEETGWIDISIDPETFEETIVLPQYSIVCLRAINEIIGDETAPYLSLVHSTFSELKVEDEDPDELLYATLARCYENTKKLKVELITLIHSIRIFQNKLGKTFDTNNVLHSYFDVYKEKISDRYYHPLKTFDSVARFKRPIIRILDKWVSSKEIREKLVVQAALISATNDKVEIERDVIEKINYITDTYDTINDLISSIDKENSNYTKSSANKILYLNNTDRTIKGHLENIFKAYAKCTSKTTNDNRTLSKILSSMQDCSAFSEQGYIDSDSVSLPMLKRMRFDGKPLEIVDFDDASQFIMDSFLEETKDIYTDERIYNFMEKSFGSDNDLKIKDVLLPTFDAFICLILATIKKDDESCFYTLEIVDDSKIRNGDYIVPNLIFHRKEAI
ncbi:MAG: Wadjet anti-phage system protein JetA family protein [Bacilli bacterium]|jgi:hypothetical protein